VNLTTGTGVRQFDILQSIAEIDEASKKAILARMLEDPEWRYSPVQTELLRYLFANDSPSATQISKDGFQKNAVSRRSRQGSTENGHDGGANPYPMQRFNARHLRQEPDA